jgi:uncharacterized membrane protein YoaK (UPF0700 family)
MSTPALTLHAQERIAALLAMVAGFVDAYGYLTYHTYVSFMSGNTTQAGLSTGARDLAAFPMLLAILSFIAGIAIGTLVGRAYRSRRIGLGLVAVLFAFVIAMTELRAVASELPIVVLTFAMGILNTAMSHIGAESVSLTFVTGTLGKIGDHLALAYARAPLTDARGLGDTHGRRAFLLVGLWSAFFAGAVMAGAATPRFASWTLLIPIVTLLALSACSPAMTRIPDVLEDSHA